MSYYTKITNAGLAAITAAMNNNSKVPITYMAFGDGNGYIPEPDENATSLVNEVYRVGVNKVEVHNKNPNWLVCEAIIPSAVGGFNIREVALYDSTGNTMLAIASYPPTYKPTVEEGAAKIQTIRIVIQVDNSGHFELIIDPDVVLATNSFVLNLFKKTPKVVKSKEELLSIENPEHGDIVLMTSYYDGSYTGGDIFKYNLEKIQENNAVTLIYGWEKQFFNNIDLTVSACGARPGNYDHTTALQLGVSLATSLKRKLIIDIDLRVSASTDLNATLNIEGNGGAVQYARSITAIADIPIFNVKAGFSSESSRFAHFIFKSSTGGTATAFRSTDNGYLSQSTFDHCVFDRSLRYGIDANIILCDFQKCDFGSYQSAVNNVGFKAIRALGIERSQEPNANSFYSCIFRNGNDNSMLEFDAYGAQWNFYACDFEQNKCTDSIIICEASGPINFFGGYIEANNTPYFLKNYGNQTIGFIPLIKFDGVHLNNPCKIALGKNNNDNYPKYKFEGCYGILNCNLFEASNGSFNDISLLEASESCHFNVGNGSIGEIGSLTFPDGLTKNSVRAKNIYGKRLNHKKFINKTFTAGSSNVICSLGNPDSKPSSNTLDYGGRLTIQAFFGTNIAYGSSNAVYELIVNSFAHTKNLSIIASIGNVEGVTITDPSFDFSINENNQLIAIAKGITASNFSFEVNWYGNVTVF